MAYPPSSTVSHFKKIFSMSNLNDWLIADGVVFVIRCIILISNKTGEKKQSSGLPIFDSKRCSVIRSVCRHTDSRHKRNEDSANAP